MGDNIKLHLKDINVKSYGMLLRYLARTGQPSDLLSTGYALDRLRYYYKKKKTTTIIVSEDSSISILNIVSIIVKDVAFAVTFRYFFSTDESLW